MITFAWPWCFLLLVLPWVVYRFVPAATRDVALKIPDLEDFAHFQKGVKFTLPKVQVFLALFIWAALVTTIARPQYVGKAIELPQSGRDLMLAVDLSGSMRMDDFEINNQRVDRLTALKLIACDFIERRKGDRIGLILFGSQAYLQSPLTFDLQTVKQLLVEASVGLAGSETALGDAVGMAVKHLRDSPSYSRVLLLLTDGRNNTGKLSPEKAAELASHIQLKIHTIGIGADVQTIRTLFGQQTINPSSELDEPTLKMIAEKTGGKYFRAYDTQKLAQIYQEIDRLEVQDRAQQLYHPTEELYWYSLLAALSAMGVLLLCRRRAL
ncbi:MAG: VWA domain-containing protein [Chlamydiales bacterium]|nr:VWA domain-containing protein [Chlamydiales bacterium]